MTIRAQEIRDGHASGWSVTPSWRGWNWAVWGPNGAEAGYCLTETKARRAAEAAYRRVTEKRTHDH